MANDARIDVRSYRTVFDLERRVYRIDGVRLNPSGVPVRGIVYALGLAGVIATLSAMPGIGVALRELPWPARHLLVPVVLAGVLGAVRIDGRPCHVALRSLARLALGPRCCSGWRRAPSIPRRWHPPDVLLVPDGSQSRLRRARFRGPGAVLVTVNHELRERRGGRVRLRVHARAQRGRKVIVLNERARLDIDPGRGC